MTLQLQTISLRRITEWPSDDAAKLLEQYPAFKLGVTKSVNHYARLLVPVAKKLLIASTRNEWILTGPALAAQTLAGANLLCRELFALLNVELTGADSTTLSLVEIQYNNESTAAIDYAKLDLADRVKERARLGSRLVNNPAFRGRTVLFVNDICVTGAQQIAMERYFEQNDAAEVEWLYLVVVEPEIGRNSPEIEWQINYISFENLLALISSEAIEFTGKCVLRIMNLSAQELEQVLQALPEERRSRLLELALRNGFQHHDKFRHQMRLLESYGENQNAPALSGRW